MATLIELINAGFQRVAAEFTTRPKIYKKTYTHTFPLLIVGAAVSIDVPVTGAAVGMVATASFTEDLLTILKNLEFSVPSANTVRIKATVLVAIAANTQKTFYIRVIA